MNNSVQKGKIYTVGLFGLRVIIVFKNWVPNYYRYPFPKMT